MRRYPSLEKDGQADYDDIKPCDARASHRLTVARTVQRPNSGQENRMAVTIIAKIKAKAGSEKALEDAFHDMIIKVRAAEPGCQAYVLHKSAKDPTQFVWYETYADQAAVDTHMKTEHMKAMGGRIKDLLDGAPQIEFLQELDRK
jgi:quinol monooxygenase YgiN